MAHLKALRTRQDTQARVHWKWILFRSLYDRGYGRDDIVELFNFLDWVMSLPEELEQKFSRDVEAFEKERHMPYVTSIERLGRQKGEQTGLQRAILGVLEARLGEIPEPLAARIRTVQDLSALEALTRKAATVASLDEFEQDLPTPE